MLRTLSIRKRLLLLMAMGLMAGVGVGAASLSLAQRERIAFAGGAASQERSHSIALHLAKQTREWKEILLGGSDAVSFARHRDAFFAEERLVREEADALAQSDASVQPLIVELLAAHEALGEQYRATLREFADGGGASTLASGRSTAQIDDATSALVERVMAACDTRTDRVARVDVAGWLLAVGLTGGLLGLVYLVLGLAIARSLTAPAAQLERGITALAHGELDVHVEDRSKDEFGRMTRRLNEALATMRELLSEVATAANSVAHTSEELSSASGSISSGAQEQAAGLAETATSLERITGTVKLNAEHAHEAARLAESAHDVAEQGGRVVGDAVTAMGEINQSSRQIADIITTIDEIAFQTNLLALNAAVEAARAGEQGRGFAVVASEVRNLAQRSAASAKEIKALIQDSVQKVESGAELVNTSGRTLSEIVDSVKRVTDIVGEIAVASREQSAGIDQVNRSVAQMDTVTQSNASQTEELSATAETLSAKGRQLQALVARFKLDEVDAPAVEQTIPQPRSGKSIRQAAARRAKRPRLVVAAGR